MSDASIVQVALVAAIVAICSCGLYVIFKIHQHLRTILSRPELADTDRALSAIDEPQRQQPQLTFFLNRVESDGRVVQNIGVQAGIAVGPLKKSTNSSLIAALERPATAVEDLPLLSEEGRRPQPAPSERTSPVETEPKAENGDYIRLRREFVGEHAHLRFSVLKDWLSINMLAILRRACGDWKTTKDLIAIVPAYLEPEAEILHGQILLVGTRNHPQKLGIPVRRLDPSSELGQCFDLIGNGQAATNVPAVLLCSAGSFEVLSRGAVMQTVLDRMGGPVVATAALPAEVVSEEDQAALCFVQ